MITFLFGSLLNEQVSETVITSPKEAITLGTLNKANISQEKIEYYFGIKERRCCSFLCIMKE